MKVNILGTEYTVEFMKESDDPKLTDSDGYFDHSVKRIVVDDMSEHRDDPQGVDDLDSYRQKVLRHEIVHAFLFESGLWSNSGNVSNWAFSEELTDWIALQSPKLFKAFQEAGCL